MITKSALRELAKRLAHDRERLGPETSLRDLGQTLAAECGVVSGLIELISAESDRKRPSAKLMSAYLFTLGEVLECYRLGIEHDLPEGSPNADAARAAVLEHLASGKLGRQALSRVLNAFTQARLDPGEAMRAALVAQAGLRTVAGPATRAEHLAQVADLVGGDAFRIHAELTGPAGALPLGNRVGLPAVLLAAADSRVREAAVGCLLDDDAATRLAAAEALRRAVQSGAVSGVMLRRMITLRNWISAAERSALDDAILTARQAGVQIEPLAPPSIKGVYVSGFDGSGAQSLVALVRDGRRHAALAALFRLGRGVGDAWVRTGLSLDAGRAMVAEMEASVGVIAADLGYLRQALPHLLSGGGDNARPPPFGMVDIAERLGLSAINPGSRDLDDLINQLVEAAPMPLTRPMAIERALLGSGGWRRRLPFVSSWFEDDATILAPAAGLHLSRIRRLDLVLEHVLPARRAWWAGVIGWTALALREGSPSTPLWIDLALVAREIRRGRPLSEVPIMTFIASATVEAWGVRV